MGYQIKSDAIVNVVGGLDTITVTKKRYDMDFQKPVLEPNRSPYAEVRGREPAKDWYLQYFGQPSEEIVTFIRGIIRCSRSADVSNWKMQGPLRGNCLWSDL